MNYSINKGGSYESVYYVEQPDNAALNTEGHFWPNADIFSTFFQ